MKSILRFLFAVTLGVLYGLFFAQKTGEKLRTDLKKSTHPCQDLFNELKSVDMEALGFVKDWAHNSDDIQKMVTVGKEQLNTVVKKANDVGGEAKQKALHALEELSKNAHEAAKELKEKATKKVQDLKESKK
jgi:gas vesicle protein